MTATPFALQTDSQLRRGIFADRLDPDGSPCASQTDPQLTVQKTGDVIEYYNATFIPVAKSLLIRVGAGKQPLKSPPGLQRSYIHLCILHLSAVHHIAFLHIHREKVAPLVISLAVATA